MTVPSNRGRYEKNKFMKLNTLYIFAIVVLSCLSSCKKDDDGGFVPVTSTR